MEIAAAQTKITKFSTGSAVVSIKTSQILETSKASIQHHNIISCINSFHGIKYYFPKVISILFLLQGKKVDAFLPIPKVVEGERYVHTLESYTSYGPPLPTQEELENRYVTLLYIRLRFFLLQN